MSKAAKELGICEDTLYHWLADPDSPFARAYIRARSRAFEHALTRLQLRAGEAVDVLLDALDASKNITSLQAKAASEIVNLALRSYETVETMARIARLECALEHEAVRPATTVIDIGE